MGFQLVDYDLLAKNIRESISTELKSHGIYRKNLNRGLNLLSKHYPERAIQCRYLLAALNCLDTSDTKDTRVLNAAAYYVREQINESYQGTVTPFFLTPVRSTLFNSLTTSLELSHENFPDANDLLGMYVALSKFMLTHVYKDSDPVKGYLDPENQSFSSEKIAGYHVEVVLQDLVKKIAALELKQIEASKEKQLAKEQEKKSESQGVGFFSVKPTSPDKPISSEPVVQLTN